MALYSVSNYTIIRESIGHPIDGDGGGDSEGGASAASTAGDEDLIAACIIVAVDLFANALLICGANKDYSGRRKDLRWEEDKSELSNLSFSFYESSG